MIAMPYLRFEGWAIPFAVAVPFAIGGVAYTIEAQQFEPMIPLRAAGVGFVVGLVVMVLDRPRHRQARIVGSTVQYDADDTPFLSRLFPILGVVAFWAPIFGLVWSIQGYRANRIRGGWAKACARVGIGLGVLVNIAFVIFVVNKELGGGK